MGGRVEELLGVVDELLVTDLLAQSINSHGGDELLVTDGGAIGQSDNLRVGVHLSDLSVLTEAGLLLGESVSDGNPDTTGTVTSREAEGSVGTPVTGGLVQDDVGGHSLDIRSGDTLTEPSALHLREQSAFITSRISGCTRKIVSYLSGGNSPDFEVVWAHEKVGKTDTHLTENPLVKGLGLCVGDASFQSSVDHTLNAANLLLLGKHGDVVLERVGNPLALATDVGDTLVSVPVVGLGESLVNAVVEVLVMRENNVTTDIVQLYPSVVRPTLFAGCETHCTYESLRSNICRGETTRNLVGVDNEP